MKSVTLIIDESGAKGYSDNQETEVGEFGVMSGYLIPDERLEEVKNDLKQITKKYSSDEKLHITDIEQQDQQSLRDEIFAYLKSHNALWVYDAIYVEGYFKHAEAIGRIVDEIKENRRSDVKLSLNEKREMLHCQLFSGVVYKGVALAIDNLGNRFNINIITDRVDNKLLRLFNEELKNIFDTEKKYQTVSGFDTKQKQVVKGTVSTEIVDNADIMGDFTGITYSLNCDDSPLTLVADVLVNSVNHYLKLNQADLVNYGLNSFKAIENHPLSDLVYGVSENDAADTIYKHPNSKKENIDLDKKSDSYIWLIGLISYGVLFLILYILFVCIN